MVSIDEYIQQPGQKERLLKDSIMESLHVALPGEVVSYDATNRTATIQPVIRDWKDKAKAPLLLDVPVFFLGEYVVDVSAGDECLVVFADKCIDGWFSNGGVSVPISARNHDLSDGFAFVGFRSRKKMITGTNLKTKLQNLEERIIALEGTINGSQTD